VERIRNLNPEIESDLSNAGIRYRMLGFGTFRTTYALTGYKLVIKFPNTGDTDEGADGIEHSAMEIRRIARVCKRLPFMRRHVPKVLYHNPKTGVVVMERIFGKHMLMSDENGCINRIMSQLFRKCGVILDDAWGDNIIIEEGNIHRAVIIDFGY
jgi:hypothetical protein